MHVWPAVYQLNPPAPRYVLLNRSQTSWTSPFWGLLSTPALFCWFREATGSQVTSSPQPWILLLRIGKAGLEAGLPLRPVFQGETLKQHSQCLMTPSLCDGCRWALFTLVRCECGLWATWVLLSQALLHTLQLPTVFFPSSWSVLVFLASVLRVLAAFVSPHSLCSVLSLAVC